MRRTIVCGLGPLPEHIAARDVADGELWELPSCEGVAPVDMHLIWNQQSQLNRVEIAFHEALLAAIGNLPVDRRPPT
jgi:DNA-binding transcriptional LysR family regulator